MVAVVVIVSCLVIGEGDALAYLDPGSGSYIFQVLVAFVMGSMLAIKMFWQNIKAYVSRWFGPKDKNIDDSNKN